MESKIGRVFFITRLKYSSLMQDYYVVYIILAILPVVNIKAFCDPEEEKNYMFEGLCLERKGLGRCVHTIKSLKIICFSIF